MLQRLHKEWPFIRWRWSVMYCHSYMCRCHDNANCNPAQRQIIEGVGKHDTLGLQHLFRYFKNWYVYNIIQGLLNILITDGYIICYAYNYLMEYRNETFFVNPQMTAGGIFFAENLLIYCLDYLDKWIGSIWCQSPFYPVPKNISCIHAAF